MSDKLYLNSGATEIELKSGDEGLYVDIHLEDLQRIIKENPEIKRKWQTTSGKKGTTVRIFVLPKKTPNRYTHYLEIAYPREVEEENREDFEKTQF